MSGIRRRRREGEDVTEPLLEENAHARPLASRRSESTEPSNALFHLFQVVRQSLTACASTFVHCVDWLWGSWQIHLTPEQLDKVETLRLAVAHTYDPDDVAHQEALEELWSACFPKLPFHRPPDRHWTDAGFQGPDPGTDFRGGGIFSLLNLVYMAQAHPADFDRLLNKRDGDRAAIEYPFCVAGINITVKLEELLELRAPMGAPLQSVPHTPPGVCFAQLLDANSNAFQELYVVTFLVLDRIWLRQRASYMDFPVVLGKTVNCIREALQCHPKAISEVRAHLGLPP